VSSQPYFETHLEKTPTIQHLWPRAVRRAAEGILPKSRIWRSRFDKFLVMPKVARVDVERHLQAFGCQRAVEPRPHRYPWISWENPANGRRTSIEDKPYISGSVANAACRRLGIPALDPHSYYADPR